MTLDLPAAAFIALEPDALIAQARADVDLHDLGDESFREPLARWLEHLHAEARLSQGGNIGVALLVNRLLVNRLRYTRDVTEHPEILDEEITAPVIITGLMRTGTTKLQRMLAADLSNQKLSFWRLLNPAPFLGAPADQPDPRIEACRQTLDSIAAQFPDFLTGHPTSTEEADEEAFALEGTFASMLNCIRARVPSYWNHLKATTKDDPHDIRRLLQYLQWQDGGGRGRPWILKSPIHLGNVAELRKQFPDATIVVCHRDPVTAMASTIKLIEVARRMYSDHVDPMELGAELLAMWSGEMNTYVEHAATHADDQHLVDVDYDTIRNAPFTIIEDIYRRQGRALTSDVRQAMTAWDAENPQHHHGRFHYSLNRYAVTPEHIHAAFHRYSTWREQHPA